MFSNHRGKSKAGAGQDKGQQRHGGGQGCEMVEIWPRANDLYAAVSSLTTV